jgi:hypothetical protein
MIRSCFCIGLCGILLVGTAFAAEKFSEFKEKALDEIEKTRPAVESAALKELQEQFKEKRIAMRFLGKGAYTAKFLNAKDEKEYFLTAIPLVSHFEVAAPPLVSLVISNGDSFRAGWLKMSPDRRGQVICMLVNGKGEEVARAERIEMLKEAPLPVPRGEAAISMAKNPEGDERILILCRSPHPAKKDEEMEYTAAVFYSGDLLWEKFSQPQQAGEE